MKINNDEIKNVNYAAKMLILKHLVDFSTDVETSMFGGLDLRSEIARHVLKDAEKVEITSELESQILLNNINFELAKIIATLENTTGQVSGLVIRNGAGHVNKNAYLK